MPQSQAALPSIDELLADSACSNWLRNALQTALARDPVDAANDAELLAKILDKRATTISEAGIL